MDITVLSVCVPLASLCITMTSTLMVLFLLKGNRPAEPAQDAHREPELLPEEVEARRMAAEAQRRYEQGFVNLMAYDGSPRKKEEREET